jgi:hypothetical protein
VVEDSSDARCQSGSFFLLLLEGLTACVIIFPLTLSSAQLTTLSRIHYVHPGKIKCHTCRGTSSLKCMGREYHLTSDLNQFFSQRQHSRCQLKVGSFGLQCLAKVWLMSRGKSKVASPLTCTHTAKLYIYKIGDLVGTVLKKHVLNMTRGGAFRLPLHLLGLS